MACRLSPLQRQLYVDILARNFEALNGRATGSAKNSLNNVLMNLRKACDHPFLFEVRSMMREQQMQPGLATCSAPLGTCLGHLGLALHRLHLGATAARRPGDYGALPLVDNQL